MAVAWFRNPVLEDGATLIDRDAVNERTFGKTVARRHPAYVYSTSRQAALMHRVDRVEIHHYAIVGMSKIGRLKVPAMIAITVCGGIHKLRGTRSRTCTVPLPGAVLCGRCHGQAATFGKGGALEGQKRTQFGPRLGCEVAGYPSALSRAGE